MFIAYQYNYVYMDPTDLQEVITLEAGIANEILSNPKYNIVNIIKDISGGSILTDVIEDAITKFVHYVNDLVRKFTTPFLRVDVEFNEPVYKESDGNFYFSVDVIFRHEKSFSNVNLWYEVDNSRISMFYRTISDGRTTVDVEWYDTKVTTNEAFTIIRLGTKVFVKYDDIEMVFNAFEYDLYGYRNDRPNGKAFAPMDILGHLITPKILKE